MVDEIVWAPKISFDKKNQMLSAARSRKTQLDQVDKMFDVEGQKASIKETLKAAAVEMGEELDDETLEFGVNKVLDDAYRFEEPKGGWKTKTAEMYVDRKRIFKERILPVGVGTVIVGTLFGMSSLVMNQIQLSNEREVETKIEQAYINRNSAEVKLTYLEDLTNNRDMRRISSQLQIEIDEAKTDLEKTNLFFNEYAPRGDATQKVNIENYSVIEEKFEEIESYIAEAFRDIEEGDILISNQKKLLGFKPQLETLISSIRSTNTHEVFTKRAEQFYNNGKTAYENGNLNGTQTGVNNLRKVQSEISSFQLLPSKANQLCSSAKEISKDKDADKKIKSLCDSVSSYIANVNVSELDNTVKELDGINSILRQSYMIKVVNKQGVRSGEIRNYTDERGTRQSGVYLIVEAIGSGGNNLSVYMTSEETGKTRQVQRWGERVPNNIFEKVKNDKMDNGLLNTYSVFGEKEVGYLEPKTTMKGINQREGQITEGVGW